MQVLLDAVATQCPVKVCSSEATSVAALVPTKRQHDSVSFGLDDKRYLRINKAGRTDLNGGRTGPWTEFNVASDKDGALFLKAVKSGKWLHVVGGEFVGIDRPEPLLLELGDKIMEHVQGVVVPREDGPTECTLVLADGSAALPWPVRVSQRGRYALLGTDSGNVACGPDGHFHKKGGQGKWAQWEMEETPAGLSMRNPGHGRFLSLSPQGTPELVDSPAFFRQGCLVVPAAVSMPAIDELVLSAADIKHFKEQGYVIVRNAVPPNLVRDALRSINFQLGKPDCWEADSNPLNAAQLSLKLPPEGIGRDVFNKSPVFWSAVNVLLGEGNVTPWQRGQQVALRFPRAPERGHEVPDVKHGKQYHIDGMGQNRLCPFSLLCGVALSEQMRPNVGNLHVFPGSHLHTGLHKYYRDKIDDDAQGEADGEKPDLGESVQVLLRPGDVVLAHQLLAHRVGINTSEHIRYQLYYRVSHKDHGELKGRVIDDPWLEFAI